MIGDFRKFNQCLWKIFSIASINFVMLGHQGCGGVCG